MAVLTSVLEVAAGGCLAAAAWLAFGTVGLLLALSVLFVVASWLIERGNE